MYVFFIYEYVFIKEIVLYMNFFRENSYLIVKMMVNQLGMTIFGLLLQTASVVNDMLIIITSVFATVFYLVLLYTMTWEIGAKDKIRVDGGRLNPFPLKGAVLSAIANIPNLILGVISVIGWAFMDKITQEPEWAANMYGVGNAIARLLNGMYIGIIQTVSPNNPVMLLIIIIPAIIVSGGGYYFGLRGFSFTNLFGTSK